MFLFAFHLISLVKCLFKLFLQFVFTFSSKIHWKVLSRGVQRSFNKISAIRMDYNEAKVKSERSIERLPIVQVRKRRLVLDWEWERGREMDRFEICFRSRVDSSCG